jgi:NH3-dependent NAD+ synthetase
VYDGVTGRKKLQEWINWAVRSRLAPMVAAGRTMRRHFALAPIGDLYKIQIYALAAHINDLHAAGSLAAAVAGLDPASAAAAAPGIAAFAVPAGDGLIPRAIIEVVPSAELSENQNVDEGKGDPIKYGYHDRLLYEFVDGGHQTDWSPAWGRRDPWDLLSWYLDGSIDRRLELPAGTTKRHCPDTAAFCKDLEEKWLWYKRSIFKRIQSPPIVALSRRAFGFDLRESTNGVYLSRRYRELRDRVLAEPCG